MNRIIRIESARYMDGDYWEVGKDIGYKTGKLITKIMDESIRGEVNNIHVQYDIYADGKLFKSLINMPVKVEYEI